MVEPSHNDDDASLWPASLRLEHGVFESRYQVLRRLSDGGMGEVVLAEHLSLGKRVAIKIMHPQYRGDAATEERFILETRAAARIHHENVVGISDFGRTADGRMFFVMEYLEGEDLAQTLRREGPLPWKRVVHMTRHVCRGIAEAHRRGVIHRDVKPGNCIRVTVDGDPDFIKVVDFGLAKLFGAEEQRRAPQTVAGVLLGTPGYMAPEIEAGQRPDPRVDLYSTGVLMIRLLTGKLPDEGGIRALGEMHELPAALLRLLYKALREDPDERFQSAAAMEEALDYVMQATARPPSLRSVEKAARPVTANKLQAPQPAARPVTANKLQAPQPAARPVTANKLQAPQRGSSAPLPVARPVQTPAGRPVTGRSHDVVRAGAEEPPERLTQAIHSGALAGRGVLVPVSVSVPVPVASPRTPVMGERGAPPLRPRSRSWVALVSLGGGLLFGLAVAVWMHMSQETAPVAPVPAVVPVVAPPEPVVVASPEAPEPEPTPAVRPVRAAAPAKASKRKPTRPEAPTGTDLKNPFVRRGE
ncbi:MAG: protein kinase [Nannocystis sp.]|uniref:protein kinase domain-containing protein n=1 Tax=Nannocystis sp. TaxID=1962667 RepID=UPI002427AA8C|nr:protein kinase [Nannocystis sp.]MBK9757109.1 protein kinase [Nannocystis sp.]